MTTHQSIRSLPLVLLLLLAPVPARATDGRTPAEEDRIVSRLVNDTCSVVKASEAGGGVTGAQHLTLRFEDGEEIEVKWKPVPGGMDGWNNSPRKELAAYEIQRLFLDPPDHVVPTSGLRCLPPEAFATTGRTPKPNVEGMRCVLGVFEVWLSDVHHPDAIYDAALFASDPVYARHMADMNLLTYLIEHEDGRASNFFLGNDPANRRVFSVDNGISFGAPIHNFLVKNWNQIRVPALREASLARLRALPEDAFDGFAVVAEMKRDDAGVLRPVARQASREPEKGISLELGALQLGLTREEIGALTDRRKELLERVEAGEVETF